MSPRRTQPQEVPPDLPPEKAYAALSAQLQALQQLKGRNYQEAEANEIEWQHLTEKLIIRAFGGASANVSSYHRALSTGEHYVMAFGDAEPDHARYQSNFEKRIQAYEGVLNSCLAELKLDLPEAELKGVYAPGEEYEFYKDVKHILGLAQKEVLIIDPYIDSEMFDLYASAFPRTVSFRLLSTNTPSVVLGPAKKYAAGGNFQFRSTNLIHDRVIFVDKRVWLAGQSLKDAAKKKPTYIVEHDEALMRGVYENIWNTAVPVL